MAYKAAAARAQRAARIPAVPEAAERRGVPLPLAVRVHAAHACLGARREADLRLRVALARDRPPPRTRRQSQRVRRPDDRVDDRARDRRRLGTAARLGRDLQPPEGGHAARNRRDPPLRPRHSRDPPADAGAPAEPKPLQHAPVQGPAADADREPRRPLDASRRAAGRAQLPLLPPPPGNACGTSSRRARRSSARRPASGATREDC